jgi:hypothetical protein
MLFDSMMVVRVVDVREDEAGEGAVLKPLLLTRLLGETSSSESDPYDYSNDSSDAAQAPDADADGDADDVGTPPLACYHAHRPSSHVDRVSPRHSLLPHPHPHLHPSHPLSDV